MSENLTLQVNRLIRTSRKRAFEAWTDPQKLNKWFAPGLMQVDAAEVDLREGGIFRTQMQGLSPRTGQQMCITFTGTYQRIVTDELLCFSWLVDGDPGAATLVTVEFKDAEGGTEVLLTHERIASAELLNRNRFGWGSMLEKLELFERLETSIPQHFANSAF